MFLLSCWRATRWYQFKCSLGVLHRLCSFGESGFGVAASTLSSWARGGGGREGGGGAVKPANARPSWRVKPGLNPVYYSDTSAEWLKQEMSLR